METESTPAVRSTVGSLVLVLLFPLTVLHNIHSRFIIPTPTPASASASASISISISTSASASISISVSLPTITTTQSIRHPSRMVKRKAKEVGDDVVLVEPRRSNRQKTNNKESLKEDATTVLTSSASKSEENKKATNDQPLNEAEVTGDIIAPKSNTVGRYFPVISKHIHQS